MTWVFIFNKLFFSGLIFFFALNDKFLVLSKPIQQSLYRVFSLKFIYF